jgi:hypothetical protein
VVCGKEKIGRRERERQRKTEREREKTGKETNRQRVEKG